MGKDTFCLVGCQNYLELWFSVADTDFLLWSKLFIKETVLCLLFIVLDEARLF